MAATPLSVTTVTEASPQAPPTQVAADNTNGNSVLNGPTVHLHMTNGGGSSATVSVAYAESVDGQTIPARTYTLAAAAKLIAGPFPRAYFGDTLTVTASASTVTLAAVQLG